MREREMGGVLWDMSFGKQDPALSVEKCFCCNDFSISCVDNGNGFRHLQSPARRPSSLSRNLMAWVSTLLKQNVVHWNQREKVCFMKGGVPFPTSILSNKTIRTGPVRLYKPITSHSQCKTLNHLFFSRICAGKISPASGSASRELYINWVSAFV